MYVLQFVFGIWSAVLMFLQDDHVMFGIIPDTSGGTSPCVYPSYHWCGIETRTRSMATSARLIQETDDCVASNGCWVLEQ